MLSLMRLVCSAEHIELRIDFSRTNGVIRPLHGINRGPLVAGGLIDLTESQRALNIPFNRLHDSHWPNSDVVDIHAVFPDPNADPARPESYDFARTDAYLDAIRKTGAQIVYRLGETIEHDEPKRFVHPPRDFRRWAQVCVGIIRHYNEGWANGFRHDIRYWEIWNEPENRPVCWTGTDEQFLALYATAAREIKKRYPNLKVGGPSFGFTGQVNDGSFRAGGLLTNFLAFCQRESVPLDFLSWHCYSDDPSEFFIRAQGIRALLNSHGFTNAESHLNEWNFLPQKSWTPISKTRSTPESRRRTYGLMAGAPGAAFITSTLIVMQDAPVDMMNLFHGETGPFGLFDVHGVPEKNYFGLLAFAEFMKTPQRIAVTAGRAVDVMAGINNSRDTAAILVSQANQQESDIQIKCEALPWGEQSRATVRIVDANRELAVVSNGSVENGIVRFTLRGPSVVLITLRR